MKCIINGVTYNTKKSTLIASLCPTQNAIEFVQQDLYVTADNLYFIVFKYKTYQPATPKHSAQTHYGTNLIPVNKTTAEQFIHRSNSSTKA